MHKPGLHAYENDYKSYESSFVARLMLAVEIVVYAYVLGRVYDRYAGVIASALLGVNKLKLLAAQIVLRIQGRRMSGDMCTSLGNGVTNLIIVKFLAAQKGGHVDALVEGDDGLFVTDFPLTASDFEKLGFIVEIHELITVYECHFCQLIMSEAKEMVKDPRRVFRTFGWTSSFIHAGPMIMDGLLRAKAMSLVYEMPQCPVIGVLARVALELTTGVNIRDDPNAYHRAPVGFVPVTFHPHPLTRLKFQDMYGISVDAQLKAEAAIVAHDMDTLSQIIPPTLTDLWYTETYLEVT